MKNRNVTFLLIYVLLFFSCNSSDDGATVVEPEIINDSPEIEIETEIYNEINFGDIVQNISNTKTFTVKNIGNSDLIIDNIQIPENFSIDFTSGTIAPFSSREIKLTFSPTTIDSYSGELNITSNAVNTPPSIKINANGVSEIFPDFIFLKGRQEVEDFIQRGYTKVNGPLHISGIDITSLSILSQIKEVKSLFIKATKIKSLEGVQGIKVTDKISIESNSYLTNIDVFPKITYLKNIFIYGNTLLKAIDGLSCIEEINLLTLRDNEALENIDGLANLKTVHIKFELDRNPVLQNINGLSSLEKADIITIHSCPILEDLNGLSALKSVNEIDIRDNSSLYNYCGFQQSIENTNSLLTFRNRYNPDRSHIINGECSREVPTGVYDMQLIINSKSDIEFFVTNQFHTIEGDLVISVSSSIDPLFTLTFLESLKEVQGSLKIKKTALMNLNGLENLAYVGGFITIEDNEMLSDFCGILPLINNGKINKKEPLLYRNGIASPDRYVCRNNLYNPTFEDLQNEICTP